MSEEFNYTKLVSDLIQNNIKEIIGAVNRFSRGKYNSYLVKNQKAFSDYLITAINKYNTVKSIIHNHKPVKLYDFYEHVSIRCGEDTVYTRKIDNLLDYGHFITLFGSGGTGKSTLFKHLFLDTIRYGKKIPIYIELKDYSEEKFSNLEDFLYTALSDLNFSIEKELFIESLSTGKYVIFLDAFDEIKSSSVQKISSEIIRFTHKYAENHYFLSSRPNESLERGWDHFYDFTILPLTKEQATSLISNIKFDKETKADFIKKLEDNNFFRTYNSFCTNPLLLTIMLLTYEEYAEIPEKLHIFYSEAFKVLYSKHDATKGSFRREKRFEKNGLAIDDFENILNTFSALSYLDFKTSFMEDNLTEYIKRSREYTTLNFDVTDFKIDLLEAVCLLVQDGNKYNFIHRSFQEYFTAKFVNNLTDEEQTDFLFALFNSNSGLLTSDEVLSMVFDLHPYKFEKNFLVPVIKNMKNIFLDKTGEIKYLNYIKENFSSYLLLRDVETKEYKFLHGILNNKYSNLLKFIVNKYPMLSDEINIEKPIIYHQEAIERIFELYDHQVEQDSLWGEKDYETIEIDTNDLHEGSDIYNEVIELSSSHFTRFNLALEILDHIEEKHKKRTPLSLILSKKN